MQIDNNADSCFTCIVCYILIEIKQYVITFLWNYVSLSPLKVVTKVIFHKIFPPTNLKSLYYNKRIKVVKLKCNTVPLHNALKHERRIFCALVGIGSTEAINFKKKVLAPNHFSKIIKCLIINSWPHFSI